MSKSAVKTMDRPVEAASNGAYQALVGGIASVIDEARRAATRSVNAAMTAAYWLIGRHIVEFEQGGKERAGYGSALLQRLATDLVQQFGRGFSRPNLQQMRLFYLAYPPHQICQTPSGKLQPPASLAPWPENCRRRLQNPNPKENCERRLQNPNLRAKNCEQRLQNWRPRHHRQILPTRLENRSRQPNHQFARHRLANSRPTRSPAKTSWQRSPCRGPPTCASSR